MFTSIAKENKNEKIKTQVGSLEQWESLSLAKNLDTKRSRVSVSSQETQLYQE